MAPLPIPVDLLWTLKQDSGNDDQIDTLKIIVAVVSVVVLICFLLFVGRILMFRRRAPVRRTEERVNSTDNDYFMYAYLQTQSPAMVRMRRLANADGLSVQELNDAAPVKSFSKAADSSRDNDDNVCAVCLEEMEVDSKTRKMPCGHEFDARCIEEWVSKANRCPVCNTHIVEEETLQKRRLAALEGRDPNPPSTRQRRRRARGEQGDYELRDGRIYQVQERNREQAEGDGEELRAAEDSPDAPDDTLRAQATLEPAATPQSGQSGGVDETVRIETSAVSGQAAEA